MREPVWKDWLRLWVHPDQHETENERYDRWVNSLGEAGRFVDGSLPPWVNRDDVIRLLEEEKDAQLRLQQSAFSKLTKAEIKALGF